MPIKLLCVPADSEIECPQTARWMGKVGCPLSADGRTVDLPAVHGASIGGTGQREQRSAFSGWIVRDVWGK